MATLLKVLNNLADIKSAGGVALRVRTQGTHFVKWVPDSWGVQMSLNLSVNESTSFNPGATLNYPRAPIDSFGSPFSPSFAASFGGELSTTATRQDTFTFYYLVTDIEGEKPEECRKSPPKGSSLLLQSDLGIKNWLQNAMNIRSSVGQSRRWDQEAITYHITFQIVTSAGATPTWTLLKVTGGNNGSGSLLGVKRDRTHELTLTFGPAQSVPGGRPQPNPIALNDALAQQIGSAVSNAVSKGVLAGAPQVVAPQIVIPR